MPDMKLPLRVLRYLHLSAQGLAHPRRRKAVFTDVAACIREMGLLQIDTINVVARSPYLVLFSRLGDYPAQWLEDTLRQGDILEYWAHEACFIPREDYRLVRPSMLAPEAMGWKYSAQWHDTHRQDIEALVRHVRENGPVRSVELGKQRKKSNGWWEWKPEKRHLETLFTLGELMVCARENFHRVYDLAERVIPEWRDEEHGLPLDVARRIMLEKSASALGVFRAAWLADYYRLKRVNAANVVQGWLEEGKVIRVGCEELDGDFFVHHSLLPLLDQAESLKATHTSLLSPFDPVVWDRNRASELFGFEYRLECYTPEAKRRYGYFVLPLLHKGGLVGRMDCKLHRQQGVLEVKRCYLESDTKVTAGKVRDFRAALTRFADWQRADSVVIVAQPESLRRIWGSGWQVREDE